MVNSEKLTKEWSYSRINDIRAILSKYKINKTGRLSKSLKIKLIKNGSSVQFSSIFYGRYVRSHYWKKEGIDIFAPVFTVKDLVKQLTTDYKKQIIGEIKQSLVGPAIKQ